MDRYLIKRKVLFKVGIIFLLTMFPIMSFAMDVLDEGDLASVSGQAGVAISIAQQIGLKLNTTTIGLQDTNTGNKLELQNFYLHGSDGKESFFTFGPGGTVTITNEPRSGVSYLHLSFSNWIQSPMSMTVDNLRIANTDTGSLKVNNADVRLGETYIGGRGRTNIATNVKADIGDLTYFYNPNESMKLTGIHACQTGSAFPVGNDDGKSTGGPNPNASSWTYSGSLKVGDINSNPGYIQPVGSGKLDIMTPIYGAIRIENFKFGEKDFGPIAIDGLQVHYCKITIPN